MCFWLELIYIYVLCISYTRGQDTFTNLPNQKVLDPAGDYVLKWDYNVTHITFEVQVRNAGFVGFGISKNGEMYPADVIGGWITDGKVYFGDYHTTMRDSPKLDEQQDWVLIFGYENATGTMLRFQRKLSTCDDKDIPIKDGITKIIYASHPVDPIFAQSGARVPYVPYHGRRRRGSVDINLVENLKVLQEEHKRKHPSRRDKIVTLRGDIHTVDFLQNRFRVSSRSVVTHACTAFSPNITDSHILKFEPVITPGNEETVQSMILYQCRNPTGRDPSTLHMYTFTCYQDSDQLLELCRNVIAVWHRGEKPMFFPEHVDISMPDRALAPNIYILESRMLNPTRRPGLTDSSGLRLTVSRSSRLFQSGQLLIGNYMDTTLFIPPGERNFKVSSHCSRNCLQWGLDIQRTISVYGVYFHAHSLATSVTLRLLRNGTEMPWIANQDNFDHTKPTIIYLDEDISIQRGDILKLDCTYNTTSRTTFVHGGYGDTDELCQAHIFYYPKLGFDSCIGWSLYDSLLDRNNRTVPQDRVLSTLTEADWNRDTVMRRNLKRSLAESTEQNMCHSREKSPPFALDHFDQPTITEPYIPDPLTRAAPQGPCLEM